MDRIHEVHITERKTSKRIHKVRRERERLTKIHTTTKPDHVWPEVWTKMGNAAQNREKQELGKGEAEARQRSKTERNLLC